MGCGGGREVVGGNGERSVARKRKCGAVEVKLDSEDEVRGL